VPATVEAASGAVFVAVAIVAIATVVAGLAMPRRTVEQVEETASA
jgi:hypothetical protein